MASVYRFGELTLNPISRELARAGVSVKVEPKVYDLLLYLIEHRNRAVDKDELQDRIWPGVVVTEASLTRCVMKARRAVGDEGRPQSVIRTIHGYGYRFVAELAEAPGASAERLGGPGLPAKPSIAVLPFHNLSGEAGQDAFCEGMADDIVTELSRFRSLFVIASHSSFALARQGLTGRELGERLGVSYLLTGGIRRSGNRLRLNARLVDAGSDRQVWAQSYDRETGDVFQLQDELARTIAATIGGRVEATRARERASPEHLAAYDLVLRAQALYYRVRPDSVRAAIGLLEMALGLDERNARAYALLAACHSIESWSYWSADPERSQALALEHGRRALELDDSDSLAHALYGEILLDDGQAELAEEHFERAIALNPNDIAGRTLYASLLAATGRGDDALEQVALAERLDPFGLIWIPWVKLTVLFSAARYAECLELAKRMDEVPNEARLWIAAAQQELGQGQAAIATLEAFLGQAQIEMPNFPGREIERWQPILDRYLGVKHREDYVAVMSRLRPLWPAAAA
jgi:TolB-like protein/DNA-binding SARP family transcriptional activator